ncbi:MAG: RING finger protein [Pseudomonadota bacterium]
MFLTRMFTNKNLLNDHSSNFPLASIHSKDDCPICLNKLETAKLITTRCKHNFHNKCLAQWLSMRATCPICRHVLEIQEFSPKHAGYLFLNYLRLQNFLRSHEYFIKFKLLVQNVNFPELFAISFITAVYSGVATFWVMQFREADLLSLILVTSLTSASLLISLRIPNLMIYDLE